MREHIIGMLDVTGGGAISLEPGGQFELSGAPLASIHQHLLGDQRASGPGPRDRRAARHPLPGASACRRSGRATQTPVMPKQRYEIMASYMPQGRRDGPRHDVPHLDGAGEPRLLLRGRHGQEAARLAGAAADRHRHLRQLALHCTASPTASCRCAPKSGGTPTIDRTGMLPFAFEDGMGFERYVDWALDVPLYFVKRGDDLSRRRRAPPSAT